MYASRTTQFIVGIFAILGIVALAILSLSLGKISLFPPPGYTLYASFDNISGLKVGDQVQLAGVQVGKVVDIRIKENRALVVLRINDGVKIDEQAIAAIKTSGIIGDKYVSIQLGPGDHDLADGGTIQETQSAFVLEDAIAQLINNSGSSNSSSNGNNGNSNCNCSDTNAAKKPEKSAK
ncbi:outer membrane lipid asymmetry maintenance protein MlaD [Candidatus Binatus sp.]|jgi:phospholipid/cholesterol/gamma-HCH transport system substrate-binding protein|uniref:outer membrane lipid asymmetry maintenance protein MlaD n=1 Tax=Candidatus Binatus sp. TaxID=2811406 RepID=UPI003BAE3567